MVRLLTLAFHQPFRTATPTLRPRVDQHIRENLGRVAHTRFRLGAKKRELCSVRKPLRRPLRLCEQVVNSSSTARHVFPVTLEALSLLDDGACRCPLHPLAQSTGFGLTAICLQQESKPLQAFTDPLTLPIHTLSHCHDGLWDEHGGEGGKATK